MTELSKYCPYCWGEGCHTCNSSARRLLILVILAKGRAI
jgi:hypothetical protein